MQKLTFAGTLSLLFIAAWLVLAASANALTSITVTTTGDILLDDGLCSLREAIIAANTDTASGSVPGECPAGSGEDQIGFSPSLPVPAVFTLTISGADEDNALSGDLDLLGTLAIVGPGSRKAIIDGNLSDRVFEVRSGARATITGLTIRHGNAGADLGGGLKVQGALTLSSSIVERNQGGGLRNEGSVSLTNTQFLSNTGGYALDNFQGALSYTSGEVRGNEGGGIRNSLGSVTLTGLTIEGNTGGGGIYNSGFTLTKLDLVHSLVMSNTTTGSGGGIANGGAGAKADIKDTRISGNTATVDGGGISNSGMMTVESSVIDNNHARSGGGIDNYGVVLTLTNDTFSGNSASDNGGGLYNRGSATLNNVTLAGNTSSGPDTGGNIFNDEGQVVIRNTIVAYSDLDGNCANSAGFLSSLGHNLDSANTCGFGAAGDLISSDPLLGTLADNGGPTWTHALLAGSPAIGAGDNATCAATDQRGVARPQGSVCDIGAYERIIGPEADLAIAKVDTPDPVSAGADLAYTLVITNMGPYPASAVTVTDTLPSEVTYVAASGIGWDCTRVGRDVTCTRPALSLGVAPFIIITVAAPASEGLISNTAIVSSQEVDPDTSSNQATVYTHVGYLYRVYLPLVQR